MGGNAFTNTQRLSEEAYNAICRKIGEVLQCLEVNYRIPPEITDKAEIALGNEERIMIKRLIDPPGTGVIDIFTQCVRTSARP